MTNFAPTEEQKRALELASSGDTMKLIAYAGAGKTATLVMIAEQLNRQGKKGVYLAFNKAIANEASNKLPASCDARTFHSLALKSTPKNIKKKIAFSAYNVPEGFIKLDADSFEKHIAPDLQELVITGKSLIKGDITEKKLTKSKQYTLVKKTLNDSFLRDDTPEPELKHVLKIIKKELQIELEQEHINSLANLLLNYSRTLWSDYQSAEGRFCIGHDVYLKLYALSNKQIKTDYILFDESQDADPLMLHVLKQQQAQVIYVGDPHQQIYDWRGAVNAMQAIQAPFSYLTKSFRFGQAVGNIANIFLNYLNEKNPLRHNELVNSSICALPFASSDVVLCRTNSGAIDACIDALDSVNSISLELSGVKQLRELIEDIDDFKSNPELYREHYLLSEFLDYRELEDYCSTAEDVNPDIARPFRLHKKHGYHKLMQVFNSCKRSSNADLTIMTVHGSKGREWDNVILYEDFEGISYSVTHDKESGQLIDFSTSSAEVRLMYVAVTRAKRALDISGIETAINQLQKTDADNFTLSAPIDDIRHIEPVEKQPKQTKKDKAEAERIRQQKAREGQKRAMAQGVEFGRPKIPIDKYLEKYSDVVEAVNVGGLTNKEIATLTGASVATIKRVKAKIKKAKAKTV